MFRSLWYTRWTRCQITVNSTDKEGKNSSVKNNVTFVWKVPYNKPNNKVDGKLVLEDVKVAPSTDEAKKAIVDEIKRKIAYWYRDFSTKDRDFAKTGIDPHDVLYIVPQDLDPYYRLKMSIKEIGDGNIFEVKPINREKNNVPSIKIWLHPKHRNAISPKTAWNMTKYKLYGKFSQHLL